MMDPSVTIETSKSIFSLEILVAIVGLPSNQEIEYWIFQPDGDNIGTGTIHTDDKGNFKCNSGINLVQYLTIFSKPVQTGTYHFAISTKKHNKKERMKLPIWKALDSDKKLYNFQYSYHKESFINIQADRKVSWAMPIKVSGQLWFKDESFPWCSGASDMEKRKVTITGSDFQENHETTTDGFSKFATKIKAGSEPKTECSLQAHYEGDDMYFDKCDSNVIYYEVVKHETSISITIEPLVSMLSDLEETSSGITLKGGRFYVLKCKLQDVTSAGFVPERIIKIASPSEFNFSPVITDAKGQYASCFKAPDVFRTFEIELQFEGDTMYCSSINKISFKIESDLQFLIPALKNFKSFDYFNEGFESLKEQSQIVSSIWLLSLMDAKPFPLGLHNKDGEKIVKNGNMLNYSGDIIAEFEGIPLIIDCTITVPDGQKIDKISNTATYLGSQIGKKFLALIISNQSAKVVKKDALNNRVLILDKDDVMEIMNLIIANQLSNAKALFSDQLKHIT